MRWRIQCLVLILAVARCAAASPEIRVEERAVELEGDDKVVVYTAYRGSNKVAVTEHAWRDDRREITLVDVFYDGAKVFHFFHTGRSCVRAFSGRQGGLEVTDEDVDGDSTPDIVTVKTSKLQHAEVVVRRKDGVFVPLSSEKLQILQDDDEKTFQTMRGDEFYLDD